MPDNLVELKNDLVFQTLFGKQKNKDITSHLLSLILGKEIKNIDLDVNKRMLGNRQRAKIGRLDIRAKFNDGEECNIELQVQTFPNMPERMLDYWGSMYSNKISRGEAYSVLKKPTYSILITNYKLDNLKHIPNYHTIWKMREETYTDTVFTDVLELHVLEIPKIKNIDFQKDELVQWLQFINNPESEEVSKFMVENKYLKQAKEDLAYLSGDPDFQLLVESRVGFLRDMDSLKADGEANGRAEEKLEIAKKMLELKIPVEQIVIATGLSKEEIEKL
jgi:predicted transposase/invertase (TIGR01784 family)